MLYLRLPGGEPAQAAYLCPGGTQTAYLYCNLLRGSLDDPLEISRFVQRRQCTAGVLAVVNKSCFVLVVCVWYVIKERELCFRLVVFLLFCDAQNFYNPPLNLKNTSRKLRSAERRPAAADGHIISVER